MGQRKRIIWLYHVSVYCLICHKDSKKSSNHATVDLEKLQNDGYNLAIVFASSVKGDLFEGAVGSTLYIDEVELSYMH